MLIGIDAAILHGYTGADHLITSSLEDAVTDAVAGIEFRRASDALRAAERAFASEVSAGSVISGARIQVTLCGARGDEITVG